MKIEYLTTFKGFDLSERKLPVLIEQAEKPGPIIWLCSAIHGNEITGIEVIHRIFKFLRRNPLRLGALYALPAINPSGLEMVKRECPYDNEDINRSFPGNLYGNTTERLAVVVFNYITNTQPNLVIDLHCNTFNSVPYAIIDRPLNFDPEVKKTVTKSWNLAEKFGITTTYDIELGGFKKYKLDKSLTAALLNHRQIPAFTVELGGPMVINESFTRIGVHGIKNILAHFKMIELKKLGWTSETKIKTLERLELIENITCNSSGIIEYLVKPGQFVKKGRTLAKIYNILGQTEEMVLAKQNCYVISLYDQSISFPGYTLLSVAAPSREKNETKLKIVN